MHLLWASIALGGTLWRTPPHPAGPPVLVVLSPGLSQVAALPLVRAIEKRGFDAHVYAPPCQGADAAGLAADLAHTAAALPPGTPVVAHGLGATLALMAQTELAPSRWVLLGPVLGARTDALTAELAQAPIGASLHLGGAHSWRGHDTATMLVGGGVSLGCVSAPFAREVQGWWSAGQVPLALESVGAPVWIGAGQLDLIAPPEVLVPNARRLPDATVHRLGIASFNHQDYTHADLLVAPGPTRAAARALGRP